MKKSIQKMLMLACLLVIVMGLSIVTAHAATVTGTISSGNEYRYPKHNIYNWIGGKYYDC